MSNEYPALSLVMPAYGEAEFAGEIAQFYHEIRAEFRDFRVELIVVDDGSTDGTADALAREFDDTDDVKIVRLSRNFGSHAAISAGFAHATGDAALTLSADRQEPLQAVTDMIDQWRDGGDIVWGLRAVRATKKGVSDSFATTFSKVYQATSDVPNLPKEGPSIVLVSRAALDAFNSLPELNRNIMAMLAWVGFDQRNVYFEQLPRPHGASKWTLRKKMKLVVDSFVEFSHAPLQWLAAIGIVLGLTGLLGLIAALVLCFTPAVAGAGTALIAGLVLIVGGINIGAISVLGEYVWRAGDDARRRPVYVVRSVQEFGRSRTNGESRA